METTHNNLSTVLGDWFARSKQETGCARNLHGYSIGLTRQVTAVIGPRRAGKSTVCRLTIASLIASGIPSSNIVYINFEDERLSPVSTSFLTRLPQEHAELVKTAPEHPLFYFLDEIQNVPGWSQWIRRMTETNRNIRIVVTGSSSRLLSSEIATELRGRADTVEIFPFSFKEYLLYKKDLPAQVDPLLLHAESAPAIRRHFMDYLTWGGFPERFETEDPQTLLQGYFKAMFVRDMVERFNIQQSRVFGDYLKIQMQRFASLSSLGSLEGDMKSIGYKTAKTTLATYFDHARDGFLLFGVHLYATKVTEQLRNPQKVYAVDNGLVRSIRFSGNEDLGRFLENCVFLELRRRTTEIFYHKGTAECDFIIASQGKPCQAIQVCWEMSNPKTAEREYAGVLDAMQKHDLPEGLILTRDEYGEKVIDNKRIRLLPVWWWALQA